jgi:copper(I)-binding protein
VRKTISLPLLIIFLIGCSTASSNITEEEIWWRASQKDGNSAFYLIHQDEIAIPAGGTVELKPDGLCIMLMGLSTELGERQSIDCMLTFKNASEATISVPI